MDPGRLAVFDLDEDDVVEIESAKSNAKYRTKASPITKYTFLQYFSSSSSSKTPLKEISNNKHVPDDGGCRSLICTQATSSEPASSGDDNVETALSNLHLESNTSKTAGKRNKKSGLKQLRGAVYDPHWSKRQEENKSLDIRYGDTWNVKFDSDKSFEDVIYPKGDHDAVTISKRDLELLEPETFINDTIIDFYILYLKSSIQPEEKHRFHFFNSFFFRKLADLEKDPSSSCERKAAFQRVHKWTRKVNLFEKDYIFIPINYRLHWSLIVICHPGQVANCEDKGIESLPRGPCILHMDSIKGSHRDLKNLVQRWLDI